MSTRHFGPPLIATGIALACAFPGTARNLPPNITGWGVVELDNGQRYGRTGQRIFVEGRDLDPNGLIVELRDGRRAVQFPRRAGGSSARIEFTIPPQAVTGDLAVTLQAVQGGTRVLSPGFGVCDRVSITAITPNEIVFDPARRNANDEFPLTGKRITLAGGCLHEVVYARSGHRNALLVGTPTGAVTIAREISRSFGRIELELGTYMPPSRATTGSAGPIVLATPQSGPRLSVLTRSQAVAPQENPPAPVPLSLIRIDRFESRQTWGAPSAGTVPFVVTQTDSEGLTSANPPKRWNPYVRVSGQNLAANPDTQWRIGEVAIGKANEGSPAQVTLPVPANAVSAPLCAVRRDGARFCSKTALQVVAGPRILTVPAGWPRNGNADANQRVTARVRQAHAITGFDLIPGGYPGLGAELVVEHYDESAARACNLDFRVLHLEATRIEFSFGAPGSRRPAACTAEQERRIDFMTPDSERPGFPRLSLKWVYQGRRETIATWQVQGTP